MCFGFNLVRKTVRKPSSQQAQLPPSLPSDKTVRPPGEASGWRAKVTGYSCGHSSRASGQTPHQKQCGAGGTGGNSLLCETVRGALLSLSVHQGSGAGWFV